jgi:hypothetical protein
MTSYFSLVTYDTLEDFKHLRASYDRGGGAWDKVYMERPQKLNKERLNLNAWGGFHELALKKTLRGPNVSASFKTGLSMDSYLYLYFNRVEDKQSSGVRLSRNEMYPSIFFIRNEQGKFLSKESVKLSLLDVNDIKVNYEGINTKIVINEKNITIPVNLREALSSEINLAFGGSYEKTPVWIDDLLIKDHNNKVIFQTDFGKLEKLFSNKYLLLTLVPVSIYLLLLFFIRRLELKIVFNLSIFLTVIVVYSFYYFVFSGRYFSESGIDESGIDYTFSYLNDDYSKDLKDKNKKKIFFYGGSKTYGHGAITKDETWVRLIEQNLSSKREFSNFSVMNWGIASIKTEKILSNHKKLLKFRPAIVFLLTGVNDYDENSFLKNVTEIVNINKREGIKTVLIEESTYVNKLDSINENESYMRFDSIKHLCSIETVSCVGVRKDLYSSENVYDSGLLWLEWVHFSSYGQSVFADILMPHVIKELENL